MRFDASDGETLGILGASGCGKSMTLRCIAGILKPDSGKIVLDGKTLFDSEKGINLPPQQRGVGLLFQNYALFPNMDVRQNILAGARSCKNRAERERDADAFIDKFGLTGLEKHRPSQLSGGQQQRVALARILISRPRLVMLDEPFSALDSYLRWQTELEIAPLLREYGGPTLLVSHNLKEVCRMCSRVCVVNAGRSERVMPVRELFSNPVTKSGALLAGCRSFSALRKLGGNEVEAVDWGVRLRAASEPEAEDVWLGVHPYGLKIAGSGDDNAFDCVLERAVEDVSSVVLLLRAPSGARLLLETRDRRPEDFCSGETVRVRIPPEELLLLKD